MVHVGIKGNPHYGKPPSKMDNLICGNRFIAIIDVHGVPEWFGDDDVEVLKEKVLQHYPQASIVDSTSK